MKLGADRDVFRSLASMIGTSIYGSY